MKTVDLTEKMADRVISEVRAIKRQIVAEHAVVIARPSLGPGNLHRRGWKIAERKSSSSRFTLDFTRSNWFHKWVDDRMVGIACPRNEERNMRSLFITSLMILFVGCDIKLGPTFSRLEVTEATVTLGRIIDQEYHSEWEILSESDLRIILSEMKRIGVPRTAVVFPRYRVELFTEHSPDNPKVEIFFDTTGEQQC